MASNSIPIRYQANNYWRKYKSTDRCGVRESQDPDSDTKLREKVHRKVSTVNQTTPSFEFLTLAKFAAALKAEACPDIHELMLLSGRRESLW